MLLAIVLTIFGFVLAGTIAAMIWAVIVATGTLRRRVQGLEKIDGFFWHPELFYHPGHAWAKDEADGAVRVGIDDFAQKLVEGARRVDLPREGAWVWTGEPVIEVDCGPRRAKISSPVDGVVTKVNPRLLKNGSPVNRDPFGAGWAFMVKPFSGGFRKLLSGEHAREWMEKEVERLYQFFYTELGAVAAADGGELVSRPASRLNEKEWSRLTRAFFRTA